MYSITKLSKESKDFILGLTYGNDSRSLLSTLTLAKVLADKQALPSSPVDDVAAYFRTSCQVECCQLLSYINEMTLIDIETVVEYTRKFYMLRYGVVNPECYVLALNKDTFLMDYFRINKHLDKTCIETLAADPSKTTMLTNGYYKLLKELISGE